MNFKIIFHTLGWVLNFEAACMLLPLICAVTYNEPHSLTFIACMAICLAAGVLLTFRTPKNKSIYAKEGFIIVALSWIALSIFGALPFVISGAIPSFIDAWF